MSVSSATHQLIEEEAGWAEVVLLHPVNPIQTLYSATCTTEKNSTSCCSNYVETLCVLVAGGGLTSVWDCLVTLLC